MSASLLFEKVQSWSRRIGDPAFRPELGRRLKRCITGLLGPNANETSSVDWCRDHALALPDALEKLGIERLDFPDDATKTQIEKSEAVVKEHLQKHYIGPANLELLYTLCRHYKPEKVLETGVAHGWSSLIILLAMQDQKDFQLISNDLPPTYSYDEDYVGIAVPNELRSDRWILHRSADREGLTKIQGEGYSFDLVH